MSGRSIQRRALLAGAMLAPLLVGCGKKNAPAPPEGEEANYTYPRQYPAPLPQNKPAALPPAREDEPSRLSPFPDTNRTTTKTYGSS